MVSMQSRGVCQSVRNGSGEHAHLASTLLPAPHTPQPPLPTKPSTSVAGVAANKKKPASGKPPKKSAEEVAAEAAAAAAIADAQQAAALAAAAEAQRLAEEDLRRLREEQATLRAAEVVRLSREAGVEAASAASGNALLASVDAAERRRVAWARHQACLPIPSFAEDVPAAERETAAALARAAEHAAAVLAADDEGAITLLAPSPAAVTAAASAAAATGGVAPASASHGGPRLNRMASSSRLAAAGSGGMGGGTEAACTTTLARAGGPAAAATHRLGSRGELAGARQYSARGADAFSGLSLSSSLASLSAGSATSGTVNMGVGGAGAAPSSLFPSSALRGGDGGSGGGGGAADCTALTPGLQHCNQLAGLAQELASTALPDAQDEDSEPRTAVLRSFIATARDGIAARIDALSVAALVHAAAFAADTKDGNAEVLLSDGFSGGQEGSVGEVLLWANLGPGKVNRMKSVKGRVPPVPFGQSSRAPVLTQTDSHPQQQKQQRQQAVVVEAAGSAAGRGESEGGIRSGAAPPPQLQTPTPSAASVPASSSSLTAAGVGGGGGRPSSRPSAAGHGGGSNNVGGGAISSPYDGSAMVATAATPTAPAAVPTLSVDLHKVVASLPAALRVTVTSYDHAAATAAAVAKCPLASAVMTSGSAGSCPLTSAGVTPVGPPRKPMTKSGGVCGITATTTMRLSSANTNSSTASSSGRGGGGGSSEGGSAKSTTSSEGSSEGGGAVSGGGPPRLSRSGTLKRLAATSTTTGGAHGAVSSVRPLGPVVTIELLALPPPPINIKGLAMTRLHPSGFPPGSGGGAAGGGSTALVRMPHPAEGLGGAATAQAFKVRLRVPQGVVVGYPGRVSVGRWLRATAVAAPPTTQQPQRDNDESAAAAAAVAAASTASPPLPAAALGTWVTDGVTDVSFDSPTRVLTFFTLSTSAHALVQPSYVELPYAAWRVAPAAPLCVDMSPGAVMRRCGVGAGGRRRRLQLRIARAQERRQTLLGPSSHPPAGDGAAADAAVSNAGGDVGYRRDAEEEGGALSTGGREGGADVFPAGYGDGDDGDDGEDEDDGTDPLLTSPFVCLPRTVEEAQPSAATLTLTTSRHALVIHVEGGLCALLGPRVPELAHLLLLLPSPLVGRVGAAVPSASQSVTPAGGPPPPLDVGPFSEQHGHAWMPPGRLLYALQQVGVWVTPQVRAVGGWAGWGGASTDGGSKRFELAGWR